MFILLHWHVLKGHVRTKETLRTNFILVFISKVLILWSLREVLTSTCNL
jgi:hypothetical protein